jgi:hypothetical protein
MRRYCGQPWWSTADFTVSPGSFSQVELRGLEPLTPCLQSDVFIRVSGLDLRDRLSLSDRHVPLWHGGNGTLMARDLGLGGRKNVWPWPGCARGVITLSAPGPA